MWSLISFFNSWFDLILNFYHDLGMVNCHIVVAAELLDRKIYIVIGFGVVAVIISNMDTDLLKVLWMSENEKLTIRKDQANREENSWIYTIMKPEEEWVFHWFYCIRQDTISIILMIITMMIHGNPWSINHIMYYT